MKKIIAQSKEVASITEWMNDVGVKNIKKLRQEDSTKRTRLSILNCELGLPFLKAENISLLDIINNSKKFIRMVSKNKKNRFLFKLSPIKTKLPKLRVRGIGLATGQHWVKRQEINPNDYNLEIVPIEKHPDVATIFCINDSGIWGEAINGSIWHFSHGSCKKLPTIFFYNYQHWFFSSKNEKIEKFIKNATKKLLVKSTTTRKKIIKKVDVNFTKSNYIKGYFEVTQNKLGDMHFVDFNRQLFKILQKAVVTISSGLHCLRGICIGPGKVTGKVVVINNPHLKRLINKTDIIVCKNASFDFLSHLKKAGGIITEHGAILSHAAIACREMRKPFVAHVYNATKKLKNGDTIDLNADLGIVKLIL